MCKILAMPGIKTNDKEKLQQFIEEMGKEMTSFNNDGLGYAAFDTNGHMFAERWHNNRDAFDIRNPVTNHDKALIEKCMGFIWKEQNYDFMGTIDLNNLSSIILHTRSATSGKDFCNTHPFIRDNTALIHNGMIRNHEKFEKKVSTCDSESILTQYLKHEVYDNPEKIKEALNPIEGYYACAALSYMNNTPIVDVFRDTQARLSAAFVKEFDTLVFTTDIDDLIKVTKMLDLTIESAFKVDTEKMIRFHALTGDVLGVYDFETKNGGYFGRHHNSNLPTTITKKGKHESKRSEWDNHYYDEELGEWLPHGLMDA